MMSAETKRKISEALKAYYAGKGMGARASEAGASVRSAGRSAATAVENKARSLGAKMTSSKMDDVTTAVGNAARSAKTMAKNTADKVTTKAKVEFAAVKAAMPQAKNAAKSLKSDLKSAAKAKVQSLRDKTTLDEKAVELYGKAKEKITGKKRLPKTYKV